MEVPLELEKPLAGYSSYNRRIMEDFVQFPVVRDRWKAYDSHEEHEAHERCEFINCYFVSALILLLSLAFKGELVALDHYVLQSVLTMVVPLFQCYFKHSIMTKFVGFDNHQTYQIAWFQLARLYAFDNYRTLSKTLASFATLNNYRTYRIVLSTFISLDNYRTLLKSY